MVWGKKPRQKGEGEESGGEIESDWSAFNMQCYKNEQLRWPKKKGSQAERKCYRGCIEKWEIERRGEGVCEDEERWTMQHRPQQQREQFNRASTAGQLELDVRRASLYKHLMRPCHSAVSSWSAILFLIDNDGTCEEGERELWPRLYANTLVLALSVRTNRKLAYLAFLQSFHLIYTNKFAPGSSYSYTAPTPTPIPPCPGPCPGHQQTEMAPDNGRAQRSAPPPAS